MPLYLHSISLTGFKNYDQAGFQFPGRITGICGKNGLGKTNLLDAIHYLCFTKSYFTRQDQLNIRHGTTGFRIRGELSLNGKDEIAACILRETGKKEFLVNDIPYTRFSSHIGRYPCVMIAPDDIRLITGGSEERRLFVDTLISQLDPEYLQSLIRHTRLLQQRNSFLRSAGGGMGNDLSVLDVLDDQLSAEATLLYEKRRAFLMGFLPVVKQYYLGISRHYEDVNLVYESELHHTGIAGLLKGNRQKDLLLQRTSAGIHRDDVQIHMGSHPFRSIASQGQRKSLLFSLKLAELDMIRQEKHLVPLLLLDDVFEKLDEERISNLLGKVCSEEEAQIFITDTSCTRLSGEFRNLGFPVHLIDLDSAGVE